MTTLSLFPVTFSWSAADGVARPEGSVSDSTGIHPSGLFVPIREARDAQVLFFDFHPLVLKGLYRFSQVDRVPENNGRNHQIESTGPIALIFVGTVSDLA